VKAEIKHKPELCTGCRICSLDKYFELRDWDSKTADPLAEKLSELGLEKYV